LVKLKKLKKWTAVILMALTVSTMAAPQAMASTPMEDFRKEDKGPDAAKGILISEEWGFDENGEPYVERTYVKPQNPRLRVHDSKDVTKTRVCGTGSAKMTVELSASFEWDSSDKRVEVYDVEGQVTDMDGVYEVCDEETVISGNGTSKATATYTCKGYKAIGYVPGKINISCNYNGKITSNGTR
jgi:hypothetical protein